MIHLKQVSSTNEYLKEVLDTVDLPEGDIVIADHQTAGKGLDTNTWESEAGKNILMSMILYPDFLKVKDQFLISMTAALGIVDFLENMLPEATFLIKWPNDIYSGRYKIGGILISNEILGENFEHVIVGIGLNINQVNFSKSLPNPTSLSILSGKEYDIPEATEGLRNYIADRYEQLRSNGHQQIWDEYHQKLLGLNEWRAYEFLGRKIKARSKGVTEFGRLIIETDTEEIECDLKEIVFL